MESKRPSPLMPLTQKERFGGAITVTQKLPLLRGVFLGVARTEYRL